MAIVGGRMIYLNAEAAAWVAAQRSKNIMANVKFVFIHRSNYFSLATRA